MSKGLRGITVEINGDTTPLSKALANTEKESRGLAGELKGVNSLLKFDSGNTELLAQKQVILSQAITQTEDKLKLLKQAQAEMAAAGKNADNSAEYRDLQREIAATQQKLAGYSTQLKNTKEAQKQAAKEAQTLGDKVYNIAKHIPIVNKLADVFVKAKKKITETVKESAAVKKIGAAVEGAKQKVEDFKNAHPHVKRVADAFHAVKEKVTELKSKLPTIQQSLTAIGNAAATAGKGGIQALTAIVGGTTKAFVAFATAAGTAAVAVGKAAVGQYADYEQLIGGVETLFKDSAGEVEKYANNAYKTAGMSANEYMETVTGFSAALISSLDGDTAEAAKKADMAITDMSDNANKMGSDISSLQSAYQGFAKQNYTMLDNLKLGYGGTKEEMQRLLDDASKLSGIKYDISSYADIVDAIHVVQTEMGITGTTAKEASTTISGSIASMKSAWQNLLTGMADGEVDMGTLIDNFADSVETVADNLVPRIMETVPRMVEAVPDIIDGLGGVADELARAAGELLEQLLPVLIDSFFSLIQTAIDIVPTLLPLIINAGVTLFSGLLLGISQTIPSLMALLPEIIQNIIQTLIENLPTLIAIGVQILVGLIDGITQAIPSLISAVIALIPVIVQAVMENLPSIIQAGLFLLLALTDGIVEAIPQLLAMLPTIIDTIVTTVLLMLPQILEVGVQVLLALIEGIVQALPELIAMLPVIIENIINILAADLPEIISMGITLLGALISGIIQAIPSLIAAIPKITAAIFDTIRAVNWGELGKNIIDGIIVGVKNAADSLINVFKDLAKSALDAVKKFFGIESPSTVMRDQVGKMLPAGMAQGVEEGMDDEEIRIRNAMQRVVPTTFDSYMANISSGRSGNNIGQEPARGFVQNLTINSPRELNPSETARLNRNVIRQTLLRIRPT